MSQKFSSLSFSFQPGRNVLIGDKESSNSSMVLVLSDSRHRIESLGIKALLSQQAYPGQTSAFSYQSVQPVALLRLSDFAPVAPKMASLMKVNAFIKLTA